MWAARPRWGLFSACSLIQGYCTVVQYRSADMAPLEPAARICCLDLDTFFVSVERLLDPALLHRPVVLSGAPGHHGVVLAASHEAQRRGIHAGMSLAEARSRAPGAAFLPSRREIYGAYARRVRALLKGYTPVVRAASVNEFFLDLRGRELLWRDPEDLDGELAIARVVRRICQDIESQLGLSASAGVGTTRAVAKIASSQGEPTGVRVIPPGEEYSFVAPLPISTFPGIGPVAQARLQEAGILTLGQLMELGSGPLRARFGSLSRSVRRDLDGRRGLCLGRARPVLQEHDDPLWGTTHSISHERTLHTQTSDRRRLVDQLRSLAEWVCCRARWRDVHARTITLK
ncbi:MAG TPA: DNA polymerase IV, partial [Deltaproteobacteria bacterium]|nr:DNA polymerase IV [Deltaproteobacteria bacterium]